VYRYTDGVIDEHLPGTTIKLEQDSALQNPVEIGTPIIEIRRLRLVEGEPIAVVTSYLTHKFTQKLEKVDLANRSLYEFLENEFKLTILQAHRAIEAEPPGFTKP
jgi:GntR family transcriptional regulator